MSNALYEESLYSDDGVPLTKLPSLDLYREPDPFRMPRPSEFRDWIDVAEWATMCAAGFPEPLTFTLRAARDYKGPEMVPDGDAHLLIEIDGQVDSVAGEVRGQVHLKNLFDLAQVVFSRVWSCARESAAATAALPA